FPIFLVVQNADCSGSLLCHSGKGVADRLELRRTVLGHRQDIEIIPQRWRSLLLVLVCFLVFAIFVLFVPLLVAALILGSALDCLPGIWRVLKKQVGPGE